VKQNRQKIEWRETRQTDDKHQDTWRHKAWYETETEATRECYEAHRNTDYTSNTPYLTYVAYEARLRGRQDTDNTASASAPQKRDMPSMSQDRHARQQTEKMHKPVLLHRQHKPVHKPVLLGSRQRR